MTQPTAIIFGAGSVRGIGAAVSTRFAREGYHVIVTGRTLSKIKQVVEQINAAGTGSAEALQVDATNEAEVIAAFDRAMNPGDGREPADVVVSNTGNNALIDFTKLTAGQFEDFWRVGCFSGFLVGREAARRLTPLGRGTVVFTGASASLRGKPGYAHFTAAKAGLRMLAQSMAREFGPKGLHVAHVIVDGGVYGDRLQNAYPQAIERLGEDGLLGVDAIAENYWTLHRQQRSAWTHELDLRPFKESW